MNDDADDQTEAQQLERGRTLRILKQRLGLKYLAGIKPLNGGDDWLEQALARMPAEKQNILLCRAITSVWDSQTCLFRP